MSEPNNEPVAQPKAGELPPLELTHEDDLKAIRNAGYEMGGNLAAELSCRERQLLAEQQVSAGLRERITISCGRQEAFKRRAQKAEASLAEARAENERLKSYRSWERIHELETELADLKYQEAPEKAWVQGFSAGLHAYADTPGAPNFREMRDQILRFDTRPDNPYTPPKESE